MTIRGAGIYGGDVAWAGTPDHAGGGAMSPDDELELAEANALAATYATVKALVRLLELVQPLIERRGRDDARYASLARHLHMAVLPLEGTPVAIRNLLAELGGEE